MGKLIVKNLPGENYSLFDENGQKLKDLDANFTEATFDLPKELNKLDLSSPEKTLAYYYQCLENGDCKGVGIVHGTHYPLEGFAEPSPVKHYEIRKKQSIAKKILTNLSIKTKCPIHLTKLEILNLKYWRRRQSKI